VRAEGESLKVPPEVNCVSVEVVFRIPRDLYERIAMHPEVDWDGVVARCLEAHLRAVEAGVEGDLEVLDLEELEPEGLATRLRAAVGRLLRGRRREPPPSPLLGEQPPGQQEQPHPLDPEEGGGHRCDR